MYRSLCRSLYRAASVRKEIKIRPGFTPQEDVQRFKTSRQAQKEVNQLPKGHIIGWAPPSSASPSVTKPLSKSQKKNAKRKEKKKEGTAEESAVPENWEDDDDDEPKQKAQETETSTKDGVSALSEKLGQLDVK